MLKAAVFWMIELTPVPGAVAEKDCRIVVAGFRSMVFAPYTVPPHKGHLDASMSRRLA